MNESNESANETRREEGREDAHLEIDGSWRCEQVSMDVSSKEGGQKREEMTYQ